MDQKERERDEFQNQKSIRTKESHRTSQIGQFLSIYWSEHCSQRQGHPQGTAAYVWAPSLQSTHSFLFETVAGMIKTSRFLWCDALSFRFSLLTKWIRWLSLMTCIFSFVCPGSTSLCWTAVSSYSTVIQFSSILTSFSFPLPDPNPTSTTVAGTLYSWWKKGVINSRWPT